MQSSPAMAPGIRASVIARLGGPHWGLLPVLVCLPWLLQTPTLEQGRVVCFVLMAVLMASYDVYSRRIPNMLNALTALAGLITALASAGGAGLLDSFLGGLTGFGLLAVFFFIGAVGAGDVKALGALGTFLSPWGSLELFVLVALCGGVFALGRVAFAFGIKGLRGGMGSVKETAKGLELPYGVAIAGGALVMAVKGVLL